MTHFENNAKIKRTNSSLQKCTPAEFHDGAVNSIQTDTYFKTNDLPAKEHSNFRPAR